VPIKCDNDLEVWQASISLALDVYAVSATFPKAELFAMTQQFRRAAIPVPSNIAEGHARGGTREFIRFIRIARGSLAEIETQLVLAGKLDFVETAEVDRIAKRLDNISRMLRRLEQSLRNRLDVR